MSVSWEAAISSRRSWKKRIKNWPGKFAPGRKRGPWPESLKNNAGKPGSTSGSCDQEAAGGPYRNFDENCVSIYTGNWGFLGRKSPAKSGSGLPEWPWRLRGWKRKTKPNALRDVPELKVVEKKESIKLGPGNGLEEMSKEAKICSAG